MAGGAKRAPPFQNPGINSPIPEWANGIFLLGASDRARDERGGGAREVLKPPPYVPGGASNNGGDNRIQVVQTNLTITDPGPDQTFTVNTTTQWFGQPSPGTCHTDWDPNTGCQTNVDCGASSGTWC